MAYGAVRIPTEKHKRTKEIKGRRIESMGKPVILDRVARKAFSLRRWCLSPFLKEGTGRSLVGEKRSRQRE